MGSDTMAAAAHSQRAKTSNCASEGPIAKVRGSEPLVGCWWPTPAWWLRRPRAAAGSERRRESSCRAQIALQGRALRRGLRHCHSRSERAEPKEERAVKGAWRLSECDRWMFEKRPLSPTLAVGPPPARLLVAGGVVEDLPAKRKRA